MFLRTALGGGLTRTVRVALGEGAFDEEVRRADDNSNQGDALCYEPVGRKSRHC